MRHSPALGRRGGSPPAVTAAWRSGSRPHRSASERAHSREQKPDPQDQRPAFNNFGIPISRRRGEGPGFPFTRHASTRCRRPAGAGKATGDLGHAQRRGQRRGARRCKGGVDQSTTPSRRRPKRRRAAALFRASLHSPSARPDRGSGPVLSRSPRPPRSGPASRSCLAVSGGPRSGATRVLAGAFVLFAFGALAALMRIRFLPKLAATVRMSGPSVSRSGPRCGDSV